MATILDTIAEHAKRRVEAAKKRVPLDELQRECLSMRMPHELNAFESALRRPGMSFICEVKKASPSKGVISEDFPYLSIAEEYEDAGADAISCLTEPKWFLGSDLIFSEIREHVRVPMIRKDFTVDPYQIYQARVMGADAVLLICALLDTPALREYLELVRSLGLAALVETHDEREIESAMEAGARIIGVNNRNLKDFSVDFSNARRLRGMIPKECIYVAESGVAGPSDVATLRQVGADAVLMGEVLMRAPDRGAMLREMRQEQIRGEQTRRE